ncbi:GNAT family N-acetyltransferase [Pseudoalteromonas denitrificans]|uniref:Acetyltransferase (GNAT) domain-containing protein n=1 Tax=Pseudoalteromonas denitrificans DSM 6059 TaxID=1123010 RepID=A0A1I1TIQ8_9GAMM|nr:GNAT family N-acetyltransferase [Pseudoalteromonas denitrificans]SFD58472.1 Acetyltransferase (GNAT) domain-containing protein [Pseudoalteromonas denitrificans DSM 6059]
MINNYLVSIDKSRLNISEIHDYLCNQSYWAKGRSLAQVKASIENAMCFGIYIQEKQVAFARVVTDTVTFAYLLDVFVFDEYRDQGIGKLLLNSIFEHSKLQSVNWLLRTSDAQGIYKKYGFNVIDNPESYMKKQV